MYTSVLTQVTENVKMFMDFDKNKYNVALPEDLGYP